jgi:hypothetical protein
MPQQDGDRAHLIALSREVGIVSARLDGLSSQIADLKDYMVKKFEKEEAKQVKTNTDHDLRLDKLEKGSTRRGGMIAAAIALGAFFGWLFPIGNAIVAIYYRMKGGGS